MAGRRAMVYAVEWAEAGPLVAYRVQELVPGNHGSVGRLVPRPIGGRELARATECLPYVPPHRVLRPAREGPDQPGPALRRPKGG
ncbi:hypothetical protein ACIA98_42530 [Streptomyces sp. NPDC051366]|uniref:hypothetical protein n=1 Tax=Streptomyces sp. NPDC051366 TaxID=3365652 RepID=UPI003791225D